MPIELAFANEFISERGVSQMIKHDILTGLLVGIILGLTFTSQLGPHLAVLVVLAVVFGGKMIGLK
jgi:hypothetical protein